MMSIEELKKRKKELGYTNAIISEKSGVPFGTVQKIFSGATKRPRYDTLAEIQKVLIPSIDRYRYEYNLEANKDFFVGEEAVDPYYAHNVSSVPARRIEHDSWDIDGERWPNQGRYTIEDYYALPDDVRVELIDGVIYDMGAPSRAHQIILGQLLYQFMDCIHDHCPECEVYPAPTDVRLDLDDKTMVEPDLLVLCHEDNNAQRVEGAPELTLEILSGSSRRKDCVIKLNKYMNAGVKEYWIVDPDKKRVFVYMFEENDSPEVYSFDDMIPIGLSGGRCSIDFSRVRDAAARYL